MSVEGTSWEKLGNDVEVIKARVSSLDRIAVLQNSEIIIRDISAIIGRSTHLAAVLHLTKDELSREELAARLGIDIRNLTRLTKQLAGKKGYLIELRRGRRVYYLRDEKLDLLDFDNISPFRELLEKWEAEKR